MQITFSTHARIRMKQRGIPKFTVLLVLKYPEKTEKSGDVRIGVGYVNSRRIRVVFRSTTNYLKIITVI